jgi:hypothetical protein
MSILERLGHRTRVANHTPTRGLETEVTIARLATGNRSEPVEMLITTTGAAKGATSLPVTGVIGPIAADQYLNFYDSAPGSEYICRVTAAAVSGATTLTVAALPEAIPTGCEGEYPPVLWDLTDASVDRSYNRQAQATFHTGGFEDGVVTGGAYTMTLPTVYFNKNAAAATLLVAGNAGAECYITRELNIPSTAYSKGRIIKGAAVVTAAPEDSAVDGFVSQNFTIAFQGQPIDQDPTPTA